MASLLITYLLWMFGGFFGLHHLYLGRLYHACVWYSTLGGGFGLGWSKDLWRIPRYVRTSNADKNYRTSQLHRIAYQPRPSCGFERLVGMYIMGQLTTSVLCGVLPNYKFNEPGYPFYRFCSIVLTLIGSSLGVYIVGNVGEKQCAPKYPVLGALASVPWLIYLPNSSIMNASALSTLATWWHLQWKPVEPLQEHRGSKVLKFVLFAVVWTSVLGYGIYFNATIGLERIPVRVALKHFFSSPAWQHTKESFYLMYEAFWRGGWENMFESASDTFDFSGETSAFRLIGLNKNATFEEITQKCRNMSAQSHPDLFKTEPEKLEAQERFIQIRDACSILANIRSRGSKSDSRW